MKIGIIGAGMIGATSAQLFVEAGHEVAISNSRGPESLRSLVEELGPKARALDVDAAARFGDVVLLAVPWRKPEALPAPETVTGKIVIDAMNPYSASGGIEDLGGATSSEHTQRRLPGTRLVKAFNTIWFKHLGANGRKDLPPSERHAIFVSGDDEGAKAVVKKLIEDIGFGPVDLGRLADGRFQEPGSAVYNRPMTAAEAQQMLAADRSRQPGGFV
jgi:8-hydroxy-5-deazaflavin:NADPH oxidoreductase